MQRHSPAMTHLVNLTFPRMSMKAIWVFTFHPRTDNSKACLGIFLQENSRLFIRLPQHFPPSRGNMRSSLMLSLGRLAMWQRSQKERLKERKSALDRLRVCALLSVRFDAARPRPTAAVNLSFNGVAEPHAFMEAACTRGHT